jgi:hypothetical protein
MPRGARAHGTRARFFGETAALTVMLFSTGLLLHESLHLVVIHALGADAVLVVRPWSLAVAGWRIYGLHAQPLSPLSPLQQLVVNISGPCLAAVPLAVLLRYARGEAIRLALGLNVAVLVYYAVIEAAYVVLESWLGLEGQWLTAAELNYGLPAISALLVIAARGRLLAQGGQPPT